MDEYINGEKVQMKDKFINFKTAQDAVDYLVKLWYKDYDGYTGVETDSEDVGEVADVELVVEVDRGLAEG